MEGCHILSNELLLWLCRLSPRLALASEGERRMRFPWAVTGYVLGAQTLYSVLRVQAWSTVDEPTIT